MRSVRVLSVLMVAVWVMGVSQAPGQQVTVATPYHALSDGFFERVGVDWDFRFGGRGGPFVSFGQSLPGMGADPAGAMRNFLDRDGARSAVVGMQAPGVFSPDRMVPFSQNSYGLAIPQFGGYDPSAGMTSGFHTRHGNFNGSLNWSAGQGYRQTFTSQTPSVTLTNGYPGSISDTSQSPFVMGFIPIVGGFPTLPPPYATMAYPGYTMAPIVQPAAPNNSRVARFRQQMAQGSQPAGRVGSAHRLPAAAGDPAGDPAARKLSAAQRPSLPAAQSSSAARAVPSVAEARRLRQIEESTQQNEALAQFERGQTAEEGGKANVAKIFYKMALRQAQGPLRDQIQARLDALSSPDTK